MSALIAGARQLFCATTLTTSLVTTVLEDLDKRHEGAAIKVPLAELAEGKAKVRSALNRATRKAGMKVATASDADYFYVWNLRE